jgi:hypothetical protein
MAACSSENFVGALLSSFFRCQTNQRFRRYGYVPHILKQINIQAILKVGAVDFFLPRRCIGECNKFDGLDNHGGDLLKIQIMLLSCEESDKREIDPKNPDISPCYLCGQ